MSITDLQEMNGFRSQLRVASGLLATLILSKTREKAANQPNRPVQIRVKAKPLDGARVMDFASFSMPTH